ncbi:hypothetical protein ACFWU5_05645 [Nocardia sp. NPDC058640]|uniref:hypothetical protein n=1 Tax=Nocardia sp. NPDC058640 TaxID=3346571 RepID=UPI00365DB67B
MSKPEPILDVAHGDPAVSKQLSAALRALSASSPDPAFKQQIAEVLAGRQGVREFAQGEGFNRILDAVVPTAMKKFSELSDADRARLAADEAAELERLRNVPSHDSQTAEGRLSEAAPESSGPSGATSATDRVIPGTRKPNREQVVTPDDPDDDDLYFQDRRDRGWLV